MEINNRYETVGTLITTDVKRSYVEKNLCIVAAKNNISIKKSLRVYVSYCYHNQVILKSECRSMAMSKEKKVFNFQKKNIEEAVDSRGQQRHQLPLP